jgi:hypothetical protein
MPSAMVHPQIDFTKLVACAEVTGEDAEDAALLRAMVDQARAYLASFEWSGDIRACYVGDVSVGGIVAVVLFEIEPAQADVDRWLWVVVGDVPPAYLVTDDAATPGAALDAYIDEMERWVAAVKAGDPVEKLIPVETARRGAVIEPTREHAEDLERRLAFLKDEILGSHRDDLLRPD